MQLVYSLRIDKSDAVYKDLAKMSRISKDLYNQYYNKIRAELQQQLIAEGRYGSQRLEMLTDARNQKIQEFTIFQPYIGISENDGNPRGRQSGQRETVGLCLQLQARGEHADRADAAKL